MWNYFIPFAAGLLQGKDPLEAGKDAAISGSIGDIAGGFGSALDASTAANFGSVQNAANVPSLLTSSTGIPVNAATNVATNAAMMPSYMDTTGQMLNKGYDIANVPFSPETVQTSPFGTSMDTGYAPDYMQTMKTPIQEEILPPLSARTDVPQIGQFNIGSDMSKVIKPEAQDLSKAGGYEEVPLYKRATDKLLNYFEENPEEAALTGLTVGGALYQRFNPQPTAPQSSPLGPQLGGKQYSGGGDQILKIRRPR